jgi:hypothetical protein
VATVIGHRPHTKRKKFWGITESKVSS